MRRNSSDVKWEEIQTGGINMHMKTGFYAAEKLLKGISNWFQCDKIDFPIFFRLLSASWGSWGVYPNTLRALRLNYVAGIWRTENICIYRLFFFPPLPFPLLLFLSCCIFRMLQKKLDKLFLGTVLGGRWNDRCHLPVKFFKIMLKWLGLNIPKTWRRV